jgi:hypothetical protein
MRWIDNLSVSSTNLVQQVGYIEHCYILVLELSRTRQACRVAGPQCLNRGAPYATPPGWSSATRSPRIEALHFVPFPGSWIIGIVEGVPATASPATAIALSRLSGDLS